MATIEVGYDQKTRVERAHVEFTRKFGGIQTLIVGPPVFSGGPVATGYTLTASQGFVDFLRANRVPFKLAA